MFGDDKVTPQQFFNWIISFLLLKKKGTPVIVNHPHIDGIFSHFVSNEMLLSENGHRGLLLGSRPDVFRKIMGDLLVSKDITQWIAYIASFWTGSDEITLRMRDTNLNAGEIYTGMMRLILANEAYGDEIKRHEFNCIYDYFKGVEPQGSKTVDSRLTAPLTSKQRTAFESLVLLCSKKSWKRGKTTVGTDPKTLFVFPKKFNRELIWKDDCGTEQKVSNNPAGNNTAGNKTSQSSTQEGGRRKTLKKSKRRKRRKNRTIKVKLFENSH
jgi:hypothetical protein